MKNMMDTKMASYLRYLGTKNAVNRASDYHYLCLAVTDSTAPVNGIDYIHPSVKPVVDYATAVIAKGLMPNGEINFEFVAQDEDDEVAARQATDMVSKVVNQMNDPHFILERWVMDANMHKNGMMMIKPVREQITRYVETQGTADQLKAFEQQAAEAGLTALRQSRRRINVDLEKVMMEVINIPITPFLKTFPIDPSSPSSAIVSVPFFDNEDKMLANKPFCAPDTCTDCITDNASVEAAPEAVGAAPALVKNLDRRPPPKFKIRFAPRAMGAAPKPSANKRALDMAFPPPLKSSSSS